MKKLMTLLLLLLSVGTQAEDQQSDELNKVIMTINDEPVTISDMVAYANLRSDIPLSEDPVAAQNQILNEMLTTIMLSQEAGKQGLADDAQTARNLKLNRMIVLRDALIERMMNNQSITEEEIRKAYNENYSAEPEVRYLVRHILLEDAAKAEEIIRELDKGADFEELAKEHSTGPTGPEGGSLGWISPEVVVAPFAEAMQKLEKEAYTGKPVQTQFGWHVILLEDIQEVESMEPPPFDTVQPILEQQLRASKVQTEIQKLRDSVKIETPDESMIQINETEETDKQD
ncbi:MAG: peptidylprolyl isomerase [Sedimenticolaceae bacterium]|nr:peptidylprolyl isomerase [Sedimenticolaceae bacterium]